MEKNNLVYKIWDLYYSGFRSMTVGKTLWMVILIKLFYHFLHLEAILLSQYHQAECSKGTRGFLC